LHGRADALHGAATRHLLARDADSRVRHAAVPGARGVFLVPDIYQYFGGPDFLSTPATWRCCC
jgi:hypothetical protein